MWVLENECATFSARVKVKQTTHPELESIFTPDGCVETDRMMMHVHDVAEAPQRVNFTVRLEAAASNAPH